MSGLVDFIQTHGQAVKAVCWVLLGVVAGSSLLADTHHAHTWVEQHVPFFWSFFGFGAAAAIIGIARWFGGSGIQARPDFYDSSEAAACEEEQ